VFVDHASTIPSCRHSAHDYAFDRLARVGEVGEVAELAWVTPGASQTAGNLCNRDDITAIADFDGWVRRITRVRPPNTTLGTAPL
jgi:hypothetical protein